MNSLKLIVFDMAGTTVHDDQYVHRTLQHVLKKYRVDISLEEANSVMGIPKPVAINQLMTGKNLTASNELIEEIHQNFIDEMVLFYETNKEVREKEGASAIFAKLRSNGILVALDTGFDRRTTDVIIRRLNWSKLINFSVSSDEVTNGRPYPDMIFKIMDGLCIHDAKNVVKVGDTQSDMDEGKNAGCKYVIGITTGAYNREALSKEYHTHLIDHLSELTEILSLK